jgi:hypothetical protein
MHGVITFSSAQTSRLHPDSLHLPMMRDVLSSACATIAGFA